MGSTTSKPNSSSPVTFTPPPPVRRTRSKSSRLFHSSCLGSSSGSHTNNVEQVSDHQGEESGSEDQSTDQTKSELRQVTNEYYRKLKIEQADEITCVSSNAELGGSTSTRAFSSRSLNCSGRFLSRFNFLPGNMSFRLNRAASLGSSRPYPISSNNEETDHVVVNRNESQHGCDILPACLFSRSPVPPLDLNPSISGFSNDFHDDQITSSEDISRHNDDNAVESIEARFDRRSGNREPVERNVRFSRTLSVGRLRDRVLRRSPFPDLVLHQGREVVEDSQVSVTEGLERENVLISQSSSGYAPSNSTSSLYSSSHDYGVETSRVREARYHDLLEHRSNFLERRRRIRSQVRALQRMGSRFENLSGHERSCILSGQHRSGRCTCHISARNANSNDNGPSARASISRLVTLAEALFEVLDEIHQQTVVLSSTRPSMSSIGSVPAPIEVVESLPVKLHCKSQKHLNEEDAQCYICLVEYEDGDSVRVLPCHHEFHRDCIDKWLKEIHRICPLCRGDICRSDTLAWQN